MKTNHQMNDQTVYHLPTISGPELEGVDGPVLYVHIGMAKTGTTWMQKIFSSNVQILENHQIYYPLPKGETGEIDKLETMHNNAEQFFDPKFEAEDFWKNIKLKHEYSLLVSNEIIFHSLIVLLKNNPNKLNQFVESAFKRKFVKIHFLIVFRDPIVYRVSLFGEFIKQGFLNLEQKDSFLKESPRTINFLNKLIEFIRSTPRCQMTLLNYDSIKKDYFSPLEAFLGLPSKTLTRIPDLKINRSLNYTEMYCASKLQEVLKNKILQLAYLLTTQIRDIPSDKLFPEIEMQNKLIDFHSEDIEILNQLLQPEHKLMLTTAEPHQRPQKLVFEYAQMEILMNYLSDIIIHLKNENNGLRQQLENRNKYFINWIKIKNRIRKIKNKIIL